MIIAPEPFVRNSKFALDTVFCIIPVSIWISSIYALEVCTLFQRCVGVPKLYVAVVAGLISLVIPATILIVSVVSSPSCTFPATVTSPSAVTFPVTSKLPVIFVFAWISTSPVPLGIMSIFEFDTVVEITLVSNLKSSISKVFNETTLSVPTVVRFSTLSTVWIVLTVSYTHLTLPTLYSV